MRIWKNLLSVVGISSFVFFWFAIFSPAHAVGCKLTSASWSGASVRVGETIQLFIAGNDCERGTVVRFTIYEADTFGDDELFSISAPGFPNGGVSMGFPVTFTDAMYIKGGEENPGSIFFTATADGETVTSNNISFTKAETAPGGCILTGAFWGSNPIDPNKPVTMRFMGQACSAQDTISYDVLKSGNPITGGTLKFSDSTGRVEKQITLGGLAGTSGKVQIRARLESTQSEWILSEEADIVIGATNTETPGPGPTNSPGPGPTGRPISFNFKFDNPLGGGEQNLLDLINTISRWIFNLAIPIAVIFIIYGGILFLTAGANPKNVDEGKKILKYAVIGLAIVFIGRGFVSLVHSVIRLGDTTTATPTTQPR